MDLVEKLIVKNTNAIKDMEANPDPGRMKSDKLGLELELAQYHELLEAGKTGKPPIIVHPVAHGLTRALGAIPALIQDIILCAQIPPEEGMKLYKIADDMGMPEYMCDVFTLPAAAAASGQLPTPVIGTTGVEGACRIWTYHMKAFFQYFDVPTFDIDIPQGYNLDSIEYLAGQLGEFAKFAEEQLPGLKYDIDLHREIIDQQRRWVDYTKAEWELRRSIPFPMDNYETLVFSEHFNPSRFPDREKVLEFWRQRVEDIQERVDKGVKKDEKLRLLWLNVLPLYMDIPAMLAERGVSITAMWLPPLGIFNGWIPNFGGKEEFGRELTPLEQEAKFLLGEDNYKSQDWAKDCVRMCKDVSADAVVYTQAVGCAHIGGLARMVADTVEKELGLPTLIFGNRLFDQSFAPPAEIEAKLVDFVEMVLARKG